MRSIGECCTRTTVMNRRCYSCYNRRQSAGAGLNSLCYCKCCHGQKERSIHDNDTAVTLLSDWCFPSSALGCQQNALQHKERKSPLWRNCLYQLRQSALSSGLCLQLEGHKLLGSIREESNLILGTDTILNTLEILLRLRKILAARTTKELVIMNDWVEAFLLDDKTTLRCPFSQDSG